MALQEGYDRNMLKINKFASLFLPISVISALLAAPAVSADYPPVLKKAVFNNSVVSVGPSVDVVENLTNLKTSFAKETTSAGEPIRVVIYGQKAGAVVTTTLTDSKGKSISLPKIVVNSKGVIDTSAIVIKVPGTYVLTVKLPNGTTRKLTITVTA